MSLLAIQKGGDISIFQKWTEPPK